MLRHGDTERLGISYQLRPRISINSVAFIKNDEVSLELLKNINENVFK
jgi:hypothetical protein